MPDPMIGEYQAMSPEDQAAFERDLKLHGRAYRQQVGDRWRHIPIDDVELLDRPPP